jgi:hypothetical protein
MRKIFAITVILMFCLTSGIAFADSSATANAAASSSTSQNQGQGQDQNQGQGQEQTQGQSNALGLDDVGNIKDSFNSKGSLPFVVPGDVQYGFLVNHYAAPQKGFEFQSLRTMLLYANRFSEGALESMLHGAEGMVHEMKVVNTVDPLPAEKTADGKEARYITILILTKPVKDAKFVGYVSTQAKNWKTTSAEVMARAALDAMKAGANVIQFTAEGAVLDTEASGWGIGFNNTFATVSMDPKNSNVATGGTGYSSASAGLREKPWLQAFALQVEGEICYVE